MPFSLPKATLHTAENMDEMERDYFDAAFATPRKSATQLGRKIDSILSRTKNIASKIVKAHDSFLAGNNGLSDENASALQDQAIEILKCARTECFKLSSDGDLIPDQLTHLRNYHGPEPIIQHYVSQEALLDATVKWLKTKLKYKESVILRRMEQSQLDSLVVVMYLFKDILFRQGCDIGMDWSVFDDDEAFDFAYVLTSADEESGSGSDDAEEAEEEEESD